MTKYISRNIGLDFIRAIAILLVLIGHIELISKPINQPIFYKLGVYGVEIFFVLSGFLIGQIIIKTYSTNRTFNGLRTFWIRRWMRTLPLYFLVLLIREFFFNPENIFHFYHFVFLQDVMQHWGYDFLWFGESWSLAVEEWFYLLVPLILLVIPLKYNWKNISLVLLGLIAIISIYRIFYVMVYDKPYNTGVRIFTPIRLDALLYGVMLAGLKMNQSYYYTLLSRWFVPLSAILFFVFLNFILPGFMVYNGQGIKLWSASSGFSVISFLVALMIPFIESNNTLHQLLNINLLRHVIIFTSLFSYCLYLVHELVYIHLVVHVTGFSVLWWIKFSSAIIMSYLIAAVSYFTFEKPILNYRDRIFNEK
jgi:peptidoglycan/LPS O-acetylase OafA/YrhL